MRCFHLPAHLVGVHVKAIEIGAHRVQRILRLHHPGCQVESAMLERVPLTDLHGRRRLAAQNHAERGRHPGDDTDTDGSGPPSAGAIRAGSAGSERHARGLPGTEHPKRRRSPALIHPSPP
jgi:hypothetical protein